MRGERLSRPRAGRDSDGARADRFAAGNVARRVADHVDLRSLKGLAVFLLRACASKRPELVAVVVIVREGAELEIMPDAVVLEFQLRAAREISSEEGKHHV